MGWTFYHAIKYKPNGEVDRKAELDNHDWGEKYKVLKSSMVGSVYYAAVLTRRTEEVWCAVFLTQTCGKAYYNFGYKDMNESMGPIEARCPVSILNLLTPTDNEDSLQFRERCRKYHADKKSPTSLKNLPVGTKIIWTAPHDFVGVPKGQQVELVKCQFGKRTLWVNLARNFRIDAKNIENNFTVAD
jgi:hypothetical protein